MRASPIRALFVQPLPIPRPAVLQLAAVLRQAGHTCEVQVEALERRHGGLAATARRWRPDLILLSCMTGEHGVGLEMVAPVRAALPGVPVVMGGPHPTVWPQVIEHPAVDIICRGEGEGALHELVTQMASVGERDRRALVPHIRHIRNLSVKLSPQEIIHNPLRPLVADLDTLPLPIYDLYRRYPACNLGLHHPLVLTGRGCPYGCTACINHHLRDLYDVSIGDYVRRRQPEAVIEELERLVSTLPVRLIEFADDTFTLNRQWLRAFLPVYQSRVARPFVCDVRADTLDKATIEALRLAGCVAVRMSVESGSERVRQAILGKGLSTAAIRRAARAVRQSGIKLLTYNIVGSPGETLEEALETLALNRQLRPDHAWCALLQPYPGTAIRQTAIEQGVIARDAGVDDFRESVFSSVFLSEPHRGQILRLQRIFDFLVQVKIPMGIIRRMLSIGPDALYDAAFKISYARYLRRIERLDLMDLVRIGMSAHNRFT